MAAPTVRWISATQASATAYAPPTTTNTAAAVGDLAVIVAVGTQTAIPNSAIVYYSGGADAGYTHHGTVDGSGTARSRLWSKVLVAGDFSGGYLLQVTPSGWQNNGSSRIVLAIFRHADGWGTDRLVTYASHNTNVANGSTVASTSGSARAGVAATGVAYSSAQNSLQVTWDGGTARDPYTDESSSTDSSGTSGQHYGTGTGACQADFELYDTTGTMSGVAYSAGLANRTHAIGAAWFQVAAPTYSDSGRGDTATDGTGEGVRVARASGRGDTASVGTGEVVSPVTASGRGDTATDGTGEGVSVRTALGRADIAADGTGRVDEFGAPADTAAYAYAFSTITAKLGGRADTATDGQGTWSQTITASGRADTATDSTAESVAYRRTWAVGDTATSAAAFPPPRQVALAIGPPASAWRALPAEAAWAAGQPTPKWRAGEPST